MQCWICNNDAKTGEHLIKASDLRVCFGQFTQKKPVYFHQADNRFPVGKINNDRFKSKALLCSNCNNALTQPYDLAWQKLHEYLRQNWSNIERTGVVNLSKIFHGCVKTQMKFVQLYFVKLFGCRIIESGIPISIDSFSNSLLTQGVHQSIYLRIGKTPGEGRGKYAGISSIYATQAFGRAVSAGWFYTVEDISVEVIYSEVSLINSKIRNLVHPNSCTKTYKICKYKT